MENQAIKELRQRLDEPVRREDIKTRQAGNGVYLDYLDGYYVVKRLNEVLGQGNWEYSVSELRLVHTDNIDGKFTVHYLATVKLMVKIGPDYSTFSDVGYGDGMDKKNIGKAHELAAKEAVTDALKRCAKNLGMSTGLALYDKNQENVIETEEESKPNTSSPRSNEQSNETRSNEISTSSGQRTNIGNTSGDLEAKKALIKSSVKVLDALKKLTIADFKKQLNDQYKATKVDDLTLEQATKLLDEFKTKYKELRLQ